MKKIFFLFFFLPVIAFTQERITLSGNVFDGVTFFPIAEANIYNFNSKKYSFTNKDGNFEILAKKGDTIIISKPIYKQALIEVTQEIIDKKLLEAPLFFKAVILKEVNVFTLPSTYDMFKKEFVNVTFSNFYRAFDGIGLTQQDLINAEYQARGGPNLLRNVPAAMSPISALYNRFSRRMRLERLHQELVDNEDEVERLHLKYNRDLVSSITGLQGEELLNFMTFCRFSYYDLIRWSPEFIISQIKRKFDDYEYHRALQDR
ncbi:MAG: carboxypeptidase-like regulatory domain-containing protein [Bacteroidetes bacterium]|nr:carboxypeptidase-like regulatory domain-containing protein [Bacteroidota bacterium]MCL2302026.1 carboxypeptidase-like regulatory domain-containing protein [Lentimicrobiaceae bacterium]